MANVVVLTGLGIAIVSLAGKLVKHFHTFINTRCLFCLGKTISRFAPLIAQTVEKRIASLASVQYYKGGFDTKMTSREAALILGVNSNTPAQKIKDIHRRLMIINHPDRGGSPYLASKLNEGKYFCLKFFCHEI